MPDFIGRDPESNSVECPAVFVFPETGDFHFRGKTVTDPTVIAAMNEHVGKAEAEWGQANIASGRSSTILTHPSSALKCATHTMRPSRASPSGRPQATSAPT